MPTSTTAAPGFTQSAWTMSGRPTAATMMSASRRRFRHVLTARVDHGHGRVCASGSEQQGHRHPDNPAPSQDDRPLALKRNVRPPQHLHDAGGRARQQAVGPALHEPAKVDRMEAVDVLGRVDAIGDGAFVEVRGSGDWTRIP